MLPAFLYRRYAAGGRSDALRRFFPDLYHTLRHWSGVFYPRPACVSPKPSGNAVPPVVYCYFSAGVFPAAACPGRHLCPAVFLPFLFCHKKSGDIQKRFCYAVCPRARAVCRLRYTVAWGYFAQPAPETVWLFYAPSQFLLALTARAWQLPQRFFHQRKGRKALPSHQAKP